MRKATTLTKRQITQLAKKLPNWSVIQNSFVIKKTIETDSYIDGLALMARIAVHAEVANHHPTMTLRYGSILVELTSHDAKGLTSKDISLAQTIDIITGT